MLGTLPGIQLFISIITKLFTSESSSEYSWRIQRHVQDCTELYSLHYHRAIPQPMTHQMPASPEAVRTSSLFLEFSAVIHCLVSNWSPVWPSLTVLLTWPPNASQTCATTFGFLLFKCFFLKSSKWHFDSSQNKGVRCINNLTTFHSTWFVCSRLHILHMYVHVNRGFYICNICICIYVIIVWILRYFYTYQQTLLLCLYEWLNSINFHTCSCSHNASHRVFCVCFTLKSIVLKFYWVHVPCLFSCQLTLCLLAKFYSSDGGFC